MFKQIYYRYLQSLLIFSIIITAIYIGLKYFTENIVSGNLPFLIVIFAVVTAMSHYVVVRTDVARMEHKPNPELSKDEAMKEITNIERRFISRYMLAMTIKLLSFLILLILYAYLNRGDAVRFLLNFMVMYVMYSIFEIIYIKKPIKLKK